MIYKQGTHTALSFRIENEDKEEEIEIITTNVHTTQGNLFGCIRNIRPEPNYNMQTLYKSFWKWYSIADPRELYIFLYVL